VIIFLYDILLVYYSIWKAELINFFFPLMLQTLKSNLDTLSMELDCARGKVNTLEKEMIILSKERDDLFTQIRGLDTRLEPENDFQVRSTCIVCKMNLHLKKGRRADILSLNLVIYLVTCFFYRIFKTNYSV
jgi:hypothetical protein